MEIIFEKGTDSTFAKSLMMVNMADYYQARGILWDREYFLRSWDEFDNFEIYRRGKRVGVIRFSYSDTTTFIRDFQLLPDEQGKGIGSECLDIARYHARARNSSCLMLKVFAENPAVKLYESKGFVKKVERDGLIEMRLELYA